MAWRLKFLVGVLVVVFSALVLVPAMVAPVRADPNSLCQLTWSAVAVPQVDSAQIQVHLPLAFGPSDVWVAGRYGHPDERHPIVYHWDGVDWNPLEIPGTDYEMSLLGATGANDIWAESVPNDYWHWDGSSWTHATTAPPVYLPIGARPQMAMIGPEDVWRVSYFWNGTFDETKAEHWDGVNWTRFATPNLTTDANQLQAISAVASNDIGAVGYANDHGAQQGMTLHWDGTAWSNVEFEGPARTRLDSVKAFATDDVWAAGVQNEWPHEKPFLMHWNGATWSEIASPLLSATAELNYLQGMAGNDVWALGHYEASPAFPTLVEHWNGTTWSVIESPNIGYPEGIFVDGANNAWISGGDRALLKWDGSEWSQENMPDTGSASFTFGGVGVAGAQDVWAVGSFGNDEVKRSLTDHWDGKQWEVVPSPNMAGRSNTLAKVSGIATDDVWAVGAARIDYYDSRGLLEHWDGTTWKIFDSPAGETVHEFRDVVMIAPDDVWAVGATGNTYTNQFLAAHWDGSTWTVVPTPKVTDGLDTLDAVSAVNGQDVWVVGSAILHWDGTKWTVVKKAAANAVSARASDDVWAGMYHWEGNTWRLTAPEPIADYGITFRGMVALAQDDVYAVGSYFWYKNDFPVSQHWDGHEWRGMDSALSGPRLTDIAAVSAEELWAVSSGWWYGGVMHGTQPCYVPTAVPPSPTPMPTPRPPDVPLLIAPKNDARVHKTRVQLDWSDVKRATVYELELNQEGGKWIDHVAVSESEHRTVTLKRHLTYVWRVRACVAKNGYTICGKWSKWAEFFVAGKRQG